jgi:hypothetical protein
VQRSSRRPIPRRISLTSSPRNNSRQRGGSGRLARPPLYARSRSSPGKRSLDTWRVSRDLIRNRAASHHHLTPSWGARVWTSRRAVQRTNRAPFAHRLWVTRAPEPRQAGDHRHGRSGGEQGDVQGSQQTSRGRAGGCRLCRSRQHVRRSVSDPPGRRPRNRHREVRGAGWRICTICFVRSTSCAAATSCAFARPSPATATSCAAFANAARAERVAWWRRIKARA